MEVLDVVAQMSTAENNGIPIMSEKCLCSYVLASNIDNSSDHTTK